MIRYNFRYPSLLTAAAAAGIFGFYLVSVFLVIFLALSRLSFRRKHFVYYTRATRNEGPDGYTLHIQQVYTVVGQV